MTFEPEFELALCMHVRDGHLSHGFIQRIQRIKASFLVSKLTCFPFACLWTAGVTRVTAVAGVPPEPPL